MVDVGDLDAVDVETVLVRCAATDDDVVAETRNGRHTRQGAEGAADVTSAARVSFNLIGAKAANTQRRLCDIGPSTANHFGLFYRDRGWLEDHIYHGRTRRRHLDFEHRFGLVAHEADLDVLDACGHIHQLVVTIKISRCARRRPLQNHIGKRDGFVRLFIVYPASDDAQGLGRCRGGQKEQSSSDGGEQFPIHGLITSPCRLRSIVRVKKPTISSAGRNLAGMNPLGYGINPASRDPIAYAIRPAWGSSSPSHRTARGRS